MQASSRHTAQRRRILGTVKASAAPLSAEEIIRAEPDIGRATVFRNLDLLAQKGEIVAIESGNGARKYIGHCSHEAVFRCQRCGKEKKLQGATLRDYVQRKMLGKQEVFSARLVAYGLCTHCTSNIIRL